MNQANGRTSGDSDKTVPAFRTMPTTGTNDEWIREDERKRIARDIHDELGQQLLVLRMDFLMLRDRIAETHPELQAVIANVLQQLDKTTQSMRAVIRGLRPAVLDLGLHAAAEWQCAEFERRCGIVCNFTWNAGDIVLSERCATALFRTLQESLTNVHRHAYASSVWITVNIDSNHIVMSVSDNGIGRTSADPEKTNSFGLFYMRERITTLGGQFAIDNAVHKGTTLTVSLPV